ERRISLALTRRLVAPRVTPNAMTLGSVAVGLVGALFFLSVSPASQLVGAFLFLAHSILDGCDGELARLKFIESRRGAILDFWGDNFVHVAVFGCIAAGCSLATGAAWPLALGAVTIASGLGSAACVFRRTTLDVVPGGGASRTDRLTDAFPRGGRGGPWRGAAPRACRPARRPGGWRRLARPRACRLDVRPRRRRPRPRLRRARRRLSPRPPCGGHRAGMGRASRVGAGARDEHGVDEPRGGAARAARPPADARWTAPGRGGGVDRRPGPPRPDGARAGRARLAGAPAQAFFGARAHGRRSPRRRRARAQDRKSTRLNSSHEW